MKFMSVRIKVGNNGFTLIDGNEKIFILKQSRKAKLACFNCWSTWLQ